jgi:hypothetical protein
MDSDQPENVEDDQTEAGRSEVSLTDLDATRYTASALEALKSARMVDSEKLAVGLEIASSFTAIDFKAMYPKIDIAALFPKIDIAAVYPKIDIAALYPKIDLAAMYPTVDLAAMFPVLDTLVLRNQAVASIRIGEQVREALVGAHAAVAASFAAEAQVAFDLTLKVGAAASASAAVNDRVSASDPGVADALKGWRSWYLGLPRPVQAFVISQLLMLWGIAWCLLLGALFGAQEPDVQTSTQLMQGMDEVFAVICALWMLTDQYPR